MRSATVLLFLLLGLRSFPQQDSLAVLSNKILSEGVGLYNSQQAAWYAAELLLQKENGKNIAGYFSYKQDSVIKTVFYTDKEKVIATYTFKPPVSVERPVNVVAPVTASVLLNVVAPVTASVLLTVSPIFPDAQGTGVLVSAETNRALSCWST